MAITLNGQAEMRQSHSLLKPEAILKQVRFSTHSIILVFADGRELTAPLRLYPPIEALNPTQRERYTIMGGVGLMFEDSDYVYHISDFLGADNRQGL